MPNQARQRRAVRSVCFPKEIREGHRDRMTWRAARTVQNSGSGLRGVAASAIVGDEAAEQMARNTTPHSRRVPEWGVVSECVSATRSWSP